MATAMLLADKKMVEMPMQFNEGLLNLVVLLQWCLS